MNDEEFEFDDCEDGELFAAPFTFWDIFVAFFGLMAGICQAFETCFSYLLKSAVGAANHRAQRQNFKDEARMAIESIPVTVEGDDG